MDYPLVILEAMSLGCPVVVAEGTPAAELAEDGAVRAVEPRADALEHELRQLLEDRSQAQSLGERARTAVHGRYRSGPMAAQYERLYDDLMGLAHAA
jgi:glycosyltransferase involved in cell wall biosynthesis